MDIKLQIEDIIENNGSDFELSKLFKQYIKEYKMSLHTLFESSQGKDFLVKHTKELDSIIDLMYKTILRRVFGNYLPMRNSIPISIVALGSYGREQLCVNSDIDLLIVYEDIEGYNSKLIIEKFFYLALDAGLKLGHRVHVVSDLFKASNEDITIKTALLESRFITGSTFIWHETMRVLNKIRLHNQKEFIIEKIDEAMIRRKKFETSMQPNIKESVGGLRDTQLIFWIAKVIYGINSLKDLSDELFSDDEYKDYRITLELLYRVRSALHLITNKQDDRLLLEYIPQVSKMLGFKNDIALATNVLQAQWRINNFTRIFVKKMVRTYIYDAHNITKFKSSRIAKGIYMYENRLYASYNMQEPPANSLLEMLNTLPDVDYRFDSGFLHLFTYLSISHPLKDKTYRLLKQLLTRQHAYSFLELFYNAGILHELFPAFRKVLHMPQFDGYHDYPVDIHSIKCIQALENIEEPFIQGLYDELNGEEKLLLKIVVLYHDTGKGRKQNHSEVGAKIIVPFLRQLKFKEELIERAVTLVKEHVLMSTVAFKENIHNEKNLYKFMSKIGDVKNLQLLYILTYADINGVGKNVFNSFNAKLLRDLYNSSMEIAQNSDRITDAKKRLIIERRVRNLEEFKELPKTLQKKILTIESNLFFFKHTPQDIVKIAKISRDIQDYSIRTGTKPSLNIEIIRKIPLNISYLLAKLAHLNVASMEIFTLFDDVKYFKIEFIDTVNENEIVALEEIILNAFDMARSASVEHIQLQEEEIKIDCEHSLTHAEININTSNQKGLLAYILNRFEKLGINIVTAKIHSTKNRANDTFLISNKNNICNNNAEIYEALTQKGQ